MLSPNPTTKTITSGQGSSAVLDLGLVGSRRNLVLGIGVPSTVDAAVFVDVSADNFTTSFRLQSPPGTDVEIPVGKAIHFTDFPWQYVKITLKTGTAGADRAIHFTANSKS